MHSQTAVESVVNDQIQPSATGRKPRTVQDCDFRAAGRLSNENARAISAIHEGFARHLTAALDAYLGGDPKVKMATLEQTSLRDHMAALDPMTYIAPFSIGALPGAVLVEFDIELAYPIIDLLLGGMGAPSHDARELSEIEEEIMRDLTSLMARQAETAWRIPEMSLSALERVQAATLGQVCSPTEKLVLIRFEMEIAGLNGWFQLALPASFVSYLLKQRKAALPQKKGAVRYFPPTSIRERILDCDVTVAADLRSMRVSVRDLIALQPGCVLKLRAPIRTPGTLTIGGCEIFEAVPVRNGSQKAAQLVRRVAMTGPERNRDGQSGE
jgi:flagellar motor switch protein FliM